jgi:hypothetical protein
MVSIATVVGEIHPALTVGIAGRVRAIDLEDRLDEGLGWLSGPDL